MNTSRENKKNGESKTSSRNNRIFFSKYAKDESILGKFPNIHLNKSVKTDKEEKKLNKLYPKIPSKEHY